MKVLAALMTLLASEALGCPLLRRSYLPRPTDFSHCWLMNDLIVPAIYQITSQYDADKFSSLQYFVGK